MTTRITRNQATTNLLAENNDVTGGVGKKGGGIGKRKALDDVSNNKQVKKRAALGEITNATGNSLKNQVKKGLTNIVSKGYHGLQVRETKASMLRQSFRKPKEGPKQEEEKIEKTDVKETEETKTSELGAESSDTSASETFTEEQTFVIVSPPRKTPPEGVIDFDLETKGDPSQHSEYAMETFQYYKNREAIFRVPDYMNAQKDITEPMRAILVDWLVEVQESFELNHETLYTAVKLTDLYLSKRQVKKEDLQLVGATACLISSKVDERIPPMLDDFLYLCDDAYSRDQMMSMERKMLSVVGFDLGFSLTYRFLRRYGRVCKVTMPVLTLARYILESSLLEYKLNVGKSESQVAASCLILAFKMQGIEGWEATLEYYSGIKIKDCEGTVKNLLEMLKKPKKDNLKTVSSKYSHKVFHEVATIPVPDYLDPLE